MADEFVVRPFRSVGRETMKSLLTRVGLAGLVIAAMATGASGAEAEGVADLQHRRGAHHLQ